MRINHTGVRTVVALIIILHGLAHAVLPLRGWFAPSMFERDFMPLILYAVATLGFTGAGLGLLGIRPFTAAIRPLLVVASAYSLVAIVRIGHADLWVGALVDIALFLTGLTGLDRSLTPSPRRRGMWTVVGTAVMLYVAAAAVLWPIHRAWGSTPAEYALSLPGDRPDRVPAGDVQHAIEVEAPPSAVWPWLMQAGGDVASASYVDPEHALVTARQRAFVLIPTADGGTRFIVRTPVGRPDMPVWEATANMMTLQLPRFLMERRMMTRVKQFAERRPA